MEKMKEIIGRLASDPDRISTMIIQRAAASDELHLQLDIIQEQEIKTAGAVADRRKNDGSPVFPNRELREAESLRMLAMNTEYLAAKNNADGARSCLRELDAAIESATRRNDSDQKMVGLVTALITAGRYQEAESMLSVYVYQQTGTGVTANNSGIQPEINQQPKQVYNNAVSDNLKLPHNNN